MRFRFFSWLCNTAPDRFENTFAHFATEDRFKSCFWCKFTPWRPAGKDIDSQDQKSE